MSAIFQCLPAAVLSVRCPYCLNAYSRLSVFVLSLSVLSLWFPFFPPPHLKFICIFHESLISLCSLSLSSLPSMIISSSLGVEEGLLLSGRRVWGAQTDSVSFLRPAGVSLLHLCSDFFVFPLFLASRCPLSSVMFWCLCAGSGPVSLRKMWEAAVFH